MILKPIERLGLTPRLKKARLVHLLLCIRWLALPVNRLVLNRRILGEAPKDLIVIL